MYMKCTNALGRASLTYHGKDYRNPNFALVPQDHIEGFSVDQTVNIQRWRVGQRVRILPRGAASQNSSTSSSSSSSSSSPRFTPRSPTASNFTPDPPLLLRNGIHGGYAKIRMWQKCGGVHKGGGWHIGKILDKVPWITNNDDASILLLHKDGSVGLDLSFVTHIFLLDKINDPALENQIISRAHRAGATGPVRVILLQVNSELENEMIEDQDDTSSSSVIDTKVEIEHLRGLENYYCIKYEKLGAPVLTML